MLHLLYTRVSENSGKYPPTRIAKGWFKAGALQGGQIVPRNDSAAIVPQAGKLILARQEPACQASMRRMVKKYRRGSKPLATGI
jgi:hypothetical protein